MKQVAGLWIDHREAIIVILSDKDVHAALDRAVLGAYGFSAKKDLLAQLLALNLEVAARIERREPVTAPGVPKKYPESAKLVTEDCIRPPEG